MNRRSTLYEGLNAPIEYVSVFGAVRVTPKEVGRDENAYTIGEVKLNPNTDKNIENYLLRELDISRDVTKVDRYLEGLSDPESYLRNMNREKIGFLKGAAHEYKTAFGEYFSRGYTTKASEEKGLKAARDYYNMKLKQLASDYPQDVTGKLIKKMSKQTEVK